MTAALFAAYVFISARYVLPLLRSYVYFCARLIHNSLFATHPLCVKCIAYGNVFIATGKALNEKIFIPIIVINSVVSATSVTIDGLKKNGETLTDVTKNSERNDCYCHRERRGQSMSVRTNSISYQSGFSLSLSLSHHSSHLQT